MLTQASTCTQSCAHTLLTLLAHNTGTCGSLQSPGLLPGVSPTAQLNHQRSKEKARLSQAGDNDLSSSQVGPPTNKQQQDLDDAMSELDKELGVCVCVSVCLCTCACRCLSVCVKHHQDVNDTKHGATHEFTNTQARNTPNRHTHSRPRHETLTHTQAWAAARTAGGTKRNRQAVHHSAHNLPHHLKHSSLRER